ncbi:MAG: tRNA-specific 2-thiouridylase, partial [Desulfovibrio sp.]|nr:tRNA-specific 2-thiouridylase [Desulfovibrio sp.]
MTGRIGVAVSGGVDSLCALLLLKNEGRDVAALHGRLSGDDDPDKMEKLAAICRALDVPLLFADLRKEFARDISGAYFEERSEGRTPNPCVRCNKIIKFGLLLSFAREAGCEKLATGHYAAKRTNIYRPGFIVARAPLNPKDQSYFLALLDGEQIDSALFPLENMTKDECRRFVANAGFAPPERRESQDICFMKDMDRAEALKKAGAPGAIILRDGAGIERRIGTHRGLWLYTTGQRKGLGIPWSEPLYVLGKDIAENALFVGPLGELGQYSARIIDPVFNAPFAKWPANIYIKIRSTGEPVPCVARRTDRGLEATFANRKTPVAAGQIAAFYD